jgi:hypothetical protein
MRRTFAVIVMLAGCLAVTSAQQPPPQAPLSERIAALRAKGGGSSYSGTERPLSTSVLGSFVSWQPDEIGLIVLWRGAQRWYYASPRSGGGGGNVDSFHSSNQFGSIRIDLTLNQTRRIAQVNNVEVSLSDGQNALLVDGADKTDAPSVRAIKADLSSPVSAGGLIKLLANPNLAPILRRSAEILSFLQCDAPGNGGVGYICEQLKAK